MHLQYFINNKKYKVYIKENINKSLVSDLILLSSDRKVLLVYDVNISKEIIEEIFKELKISGFQIFKKEVLGGKENKNEKFLFNILDSLSSNKFTKNSILLSVGGGVVGDVTGLSASLFMRGINYVHIPSTMMAVLDSCLGGKNAINYKHRINLIGSYYHPHRVYISGKLIKKIPQRDFISGLAEAIKCGIIDNEKILFLLENFKKEILDRNFKIIQKLCNLVLRSKIKFFLTDIYEQNTRLYLNFGHTFAHAIEMVQNQIHFPNKLNHGEAVSVGMVCEMLYGKTKKKIIDRTINLLNFYNLPTFFKLSKNSNQQKIQSHIYENIFLDKKNDGKFARYIKISDLKKKKIAKIDNMYLLNDVIYKILKIKP